ncbi:MAG: hypothetical protein GYB64_18790 [Chloroflexi bacterium]|nr:hypothetical protein [Chloroflexota bacterium]
MACQSAPVSIFTLEAVEHEPHPEGCEAQAIAIHVNDTAGNPVEGITATLRTVGTDGVETTQTTDSNGEAVFTAASEETTYFLRLSRTEDDLSDTVVVEHFPACTRNLTRVTFVQR